MSATRTFSFVADKACRSVSQSGVELWTLTVSAGALPLDFPLDPNARDSKKNRVVRAMLETLQDEPDKFVIFNNGIMMVAGSIQVRGDKVNLTCDEEMHGVLNGGHTYLALEEALRSEDTYPLAEHAQVLLTVGIGIPPADIADISRARNTSAKVEEYALAGLEGRWDSFKQHLPSEYRARVWFKPNDADAPDAKYDIRDLVRLLGCINRDIFPDRTTSPHKVYSSLGTFIQKVTTDQVNAYAHLLTDAIWIDAEIRKLISTEGSGWSRLKGIDNKQTEVLITGDQVYRIAFPFVLPVLAAFRAFIDPKKRQWRESLREKLWPEHGPHLANKLRAMYTSRGGSNPHSFGRDEAVWSSLYMEALLHSGYQDGAS